MFCYPSSLGHSTGRYEGIDEPGIDNESVSMVVIVCSLIWSGRVVAVSRYASRLERVTGRYEGIHEPGIDSPSQDQQRHFFRAAQLLFAQAWSELV